MFDTDIRKNIQVNCHKSIALRVLIYQGEGWAFEKKNSVTYSDRNQRRDTNQDMCLTYSHMKRKYETRLYIMTPTLPQDTNKRISVKYIIYNPICFGVLRHHPQGKNVKTRNDKTLEGRM
jgi:hypothetical protein